MAENRSENAVIRDYRRHPLVRAFCFKNRVVILFL